MSAERSTYSQAFAILCNRLPRIEAEKLRESLDPDGSLGCRVVVSGSHDVGNPVVRGWIQTGPHRIELISVAAPADDDASRLALQASELAPDERRLLLDHKAYIQCLYAGESREPLAQARNLYSVAPALFQACASAEPLGLLNVPALIALTRTDAEAMLQWLNSEPPPLDLWVRVIALGGETGGLWLVTRGLYAFMQPEVAVNGAHVSDEQSAESLLMSIASWLVCGTGELHPGDTLEMLAEEDRESRLSRWSCRLPTRKQSFLAAPHGTLILEPAS